MGHKMVLRFDTDKTAQRVIRQLVAAIVRHEGGSEETAKEIEIVTGELMANAFEHAYQRQSAPLEIDLSYDRTKFEFTIHDDGEPITDSPVIPKDVPKGPRGRGLYLVGHLTDEAEVIHPWNADRGVAVRVVKYLRPKEMRERGPAS